MTSAPGGDVPLDVSVGESGEIGLGDDQLLRIVAEVAEIFLYAQQTGSTLQNKKIGT
jgi:hypothetical protein